MLVDRAITPDAVAEEGLRIAPNDGYSVGGQSMSGITPAKGFGLTVQWTTRTTTLSPVPKSSTSVLAHGTTPTMPASKTAVSGIDKTASSSQTTVPTSASPSADFSRSHTGFFHNRGAVAGVFCVLGLVAVVALVLGYMLRRRRLARRRRGALGTAGAEAWAELPSGIDVTQPAHSDVHRLFSGWEAGSDDAASVSSGGSLHMTFGQPAMDADSATTHASSLYTNATLPPYPSTVRSLSPPAYSELSGTLSRMRESDVVQRSAILGQEEAYSWSESEKDQQG